MHQLIQHLRTGQLEVATAPAPGVAPGVAVIRTRASLISAGTERMLVEFSQAGLLQKARAQPEKVKQVLDKIGADGLLPTLEAVFRKLDEPLPLGYCNAGVVIEADPALRDAGIEPGARVASNGPHAEIVSAPRHLCARIPDNVSDDEAAFTVLGAVALQGIRLIAPTLGERVMVVGLGLIGQLAVQLLRANGCEVLGVDPRADRQDLAAGFGARVVRGDGDPVATALEWTGGQGVDAVLVTASAPTDEIMHQAAQACRKRGRIVLVGVVGLNLRRDDFYKKELTFQVSCSYGPGRHDEAYEQGGHDYPLPFARWTGQRNFAAVLELMARGALNVKPLITHRVPFAEAARAYDLIQTGGALGVVLQYPEAADTRRVVEIAAAPAAAVAPAEPVVGVIGAGSFASAVILPCLVKAGARLVALAGQSHPAAVANAARKFGFTRAATDAQNVLTDPAINTVFILTRHDSHARLVCAALDAGKHVFVEKPLCLNAAELDQVRAAQARHPDRLLMVGFNRRFSPHIVRIRAALAGRAAPLDMTMTVNAGAVPPDHWIHDPARGGGRIIGEGCHFIDLLSFLAGSPVVRVAGCCAGTGTVVREDQAVLSLTFADGSIGAIHYFANGSRRYPKETLEVFSEGRVFRMENYRRTAAWDAKGFRTLRAWRQDKGHAAEVVAFLDAIRSGRPAPIAPAELFNVTRATLCAAEAARTGATLAVTDIS